MKAKMKAGLCVVAVLMLLAAGARANLLSNGNFEDTTGWGAIGSTDFPSGWGVTGDVNPAALQSGMNAIGGSGTSAYMAPGSSSAYCLNQVLSTPIFTWTYDFDIASEDSGGSTNRSLSGGMMEAGKQLITFRVNGNGDFQVYERGGRGWYTPTGLAGAIIFDDDVQTTPLVNHITIGGSITGSAISYDVTVVDSDSVSHQATGIGSLNYPIVGSGMNEMSFDTSGSGSYVLDNVTLVPEPATMALLGMGGLSLLRRRK